MSELVPLTFDEELLSALGRLNLEYPEIWDNDAEQPVKTLKMPASHLTVHLVKWPIPYECVYVHVESLHVLEICDISMDLVSDNPPKARGLSLRRCVAGWGLPRDFDEVVLYLAGQPIFAGGWSSQFNTLEGTCLVKEMEDLVHALANAPTERELREKY